MPANLRIKYLPVDELVPYARNARTHSEEQVTERNGRGPSWAEKHQGLATRSDPVVPGLFFRCNVARRCNVRPERARGR